jgi:predicted dienelactone hydrolase
MQRLTAVLGNTVRSLGVLLFFSLSTVSLHAADTAYDPLAEPANFSAQTLDLVVHDADRQRDIPVLIYLPSDKSPAPVVLFSHGLGGSRFGSAYLGKHWAARGYVAVYLQHPGSDTSVWKDKPADERFADLKQAINVENFLARVQDVPAVLDQLERWNKSAGDPLFGRLGLQHVGMSGHSFGAATAQAVSGESFPVGGTSYTDGRIKAAIAFSPSSPRGGIDPKDAFADVKIPWMLMTGTDDTTPISDATAASRLLVFPALPPGGKYELVLDGAEHSAFTDTALPGDHLPRNPNHHRVILALSTAFWDAYLRDDQAAKAWLDGSGPATVLEAKDHWQRK